MILLRAPLLLDPSLITQYIVEKNGKNFKLLSLCKKSYGTLSMDAIFFGQPCTYTIWQYFIYLQKWKESVPGHNYSLCLPPDLESTVSYTRQ